MISAHTISNLCVLLCSLFFSSVSRSTTRCRVPNLSNVWNKGGGGGEQDDDMATVTAANLVSREKCYFKSFAKFVRTHQPNNESLSSS